jgi:hypothetical protein
MAKKSTQLEKVAPKNGAIIDFKAELKRQAEAAALQEANAGGGQFFSLKSGQLSFGGNPIPNNEMAVVVLDHIAENVYTSIPYAPDQAFNPECYAFGRADAEMKPHADARDKQAPACAGCPLNEFGSSNVGRGKACKNRRRLACISAGLFDKAGEFQLASEKQLADGAVGYLALPPTSINGWAQYVKSLNATLDLPPRGVVTKVTVVPDAKTQFRVQFTPLGPVPDELLGTVMARAKEVEAQIAFPYQAQTEAAKPAGGKAKPAVKARKF